MSADPGLPPRVHPHLWCCTCLETGLDDRTPCSVADSAVERHHHAHQTPSQQQHSKAGNQESRKPGNQSRAGQSSSTETGHPPARCLPPPPAATPNFHRVQSALQHNPLLRRDIKSILYEASVSAPDSKHLQSLALALFLASWPAGENSRNIVSPCRRPSSPCPLTNPDEEPLPIYPPTLSASPLLLLLLCSGLSGLASVCKAATPPSTPTRF